MKNPQNHSDTSPAQRALRKKNIRLALLLGGFALLVLVTSFPFWQEVLVAVARSNG